MNRLPISPVDLHVHSSASDGALEPALVAERAARLGLGLVALTDHDRLDASIELAGRDPARAVVGIELSCVGDGGRVDLLGLGLTKPATLALTIPWPALNATRYRMWVRALHGIGVELDPDIPLDGLPAWQAIKATVAASSVAQAALGGRDWAATLQTALGRAGAADISDQMSRSGLLPDVFTGIRRIQAAGGLAIWAHPGLDLAGDEGIASRLERWVPAGLDGLEVYHPAHDAVVRRRLTAAARHYGLLRSAGSDTHDDPDSLGRTGLLPLEVLEALFARLSPPVAAGA